MAICYKIEAYVLDLHENFDTKEELSQELQNIRYIEFLRVQDIQETDVGEWHDDHELNKRGANYRKFFPDDYAGPDDVHLREEYRRVRSIMLQQIEKNGALEDHNSRLASELEKLKKVQEFVKTIGELTK